MYMNDEIAQHLQNHDVRPTAVRIMIWKTLRDFDYAFPMADLEGLLPTVDRSTIFRALTLFVDHDLLSVTTSVPMVHVRIIITNCASTSTSPARSAARPIASKTKESPRYMYLRDSKWSGSSISFTAFVPNARIIAKIIDSLSRIREFANCVMPMGFYIIIL